MSSRVCPACGCLNSVSEPACYRCKRPLPSAVGGALKGFLSIPALATRAVTLFCLVVFALMVATDGKLPIAPSFGFGEPFRDYTFVRFGLLVNDGRFEWWRLVSAVFVHHDVFHIGMNLWGLVSFGAWLEARFGAARTFLLFLLTGILGFVASAIWGTPYTSGASGGIFGFIGANVGIVMGRKDPNWKEMLWQQLAYALILGLVMRADTAAHLGGFAAGIALGRLFERERPRPIVTSILGVLAGLGALMSVASIGLSLVSPITRDERGRSVVDE